MSNKNYTAYQHMAYDAFVRRGLTDSEASFMVNKVANAVKQVYPDGNCTCFRASVDGKQDEQYEQAFEGGCCAAFDDEVLLHSGKRVKFGFNYGH